MNSTARRRFLMVIHYPLFGGPHNQAVELSAPLAARRWETIAVLPSEPGNAAQRLRAAGLFVEQVPLHRLRASADPRLAVRFPIGFRRDVAVLRSLIRRHDADLVLVPGLVNPQAALAGRLERVPVVWQVLDTRTPPALRRLFTPLVRRWADAVMSTGVATAAAHGLDDLGDRLVPYYPPVRLDGFRSNPAARARARAELGLEEDALVVGTVGNLTPMKGHGLLIRAVARLRASDGRVRAVVLGATTRTHSAYASALLREARSLGLRVGEDVVVRDPVGRVAELALAFDVFALSSERRSEGIPTALGEALALGLPVVATAVGGVEEALAGGAGIVVPPEQTEAFADALEAVLTDGPLRSRLGTAARAAASRFDVGTSADAHERAFERACERAAACGRGGG